MQEQDPRLVIFSLRKLLPHRLLASAWTRNSPFGDDLSGNCDDGAVTAYFAGAIDWNFSKMQTLSNAPQQNSQYARCSCNGVELHVTGKPLFRGYCHCATCQAYSGSDYADVSVFRASDVSITNEAAVAFKSYQKPSVVQRGKCISCTEPTHEKVTLPALPDLVIVATEILPASLVVEPMMHIFYHRRIRDVTDNVPRYSGFVKSQSAFMTTLFKSLWRSRGQKAT